MPGEHDTPDPLPDFFEDAFMTAVLDRSVEVEVGNADGVSN